jgi:hypothetical protein
MPQMWVELTANKQVEHGGKKKVYHAGDRTSLSLFHALEWINEGCAKPLDSVVMTTSVPKDGGIIVTAEDGQAEAAKRLKYDVVKGLPALVWTRTMLWDTSAQLRIDLISPAFMWLSWWECVVPLWSYTELAASMGDEKEREYTKSIVRDLRVPVYDPRCMWLRKCPDCAELLRLFGEEKTKGKDDRLALLRAIYMVKPVICAAPASWIAK